MSKKVTTRKLIVRNSAFIAAMQQSITDGSARAGKIVEQAKASGVLDALIKMNKKSSTPSSLH